MFLAQRSLIYPAAAIAPQIADQRLAELRAIVTEPEPGLRITHWYHPPAGEREPLVVFFHGNGRDLGTAFLKIRPFVEPGVGLRAENGRASWWGSVWTYGAIAVG